MKIYESCEHVTTVRRCVGRFEEDVAISSPREKLSVTPPPKLLAIERFYLKKNDQAVRRFIPGVTKNPLKISTVEEENCSIAADFIALSDLQETKTYRHYQLKQIRPNENKRKK